MRTIRNCEVCVIGGAGFLGSTLVDHLIDDRGCRVFVLDNLISGLRKHVHKEAHFEWFDIRDDHYHLCEFLNDMDIEYVFNYAAEPYIPECFSRPMHFFDINATSVLKVLEACRLAEVKGLLQVSSAEIYGDMKGKISETDPIKPHSTYGVSKVAADGLVQVRWREAQTSAIALRQFNCVGPRETHEYVIPEIISQIHHNSTKNYSTTPPAKTVGVRLGNNSTRDFLGSYDAVKMAVELLEKGEFGEVYNMGSQQAITIYDLAKLIGEVMGVGVSVITDEDRIRPWEIWHLQSDNTKLFKAIGPRGLAQLEESIQYTVEYFYGNGNKWDW